MRASTRNVLLKSAWALPLVICVSPVLGQTAASNAGAAATSERFAEWKAAQPGTPMPVSVSFGSPIPDAQAVALLRRYGVKAVAVHFIIAGTWGVHRINPDRSNAAADPIAEARSRAIEMSQRAFAADKERAKRLLSGDSAQKSPTDINATARYKAFLDFVDHGRSVMRAAQGNTPMVYALEVIGPVDAVQALAADAVVRETKAGRKLDNGHLVVPRPAAPQVGARTMSADVSRLSSEEARQRVEDIAQNGVRVP